MGANLAWLGCGAYCLGLTMVSLGVRYAGLGLWSGVALGLTLALIGAGLAALILPSRWPLGPPLGGWLALGAIAALAALNYGWHYPSPDRLDISHQLKPLGSPEQVVWGQIETMPRLNRNGKGQFWLQSDRARPVDPHSPIQSPPQPVRGRLYVTLAAEAIKPLHPGLRVKLQGKLYVPAPAKNPHGFDLPHYLASQDCYAGFSARQVQIQVGDRSLGWGLWRVRQRIAQAHLQGLGERAGALVSAMALDRRAVNLPYDLQDSFIQAGLAHILAASGFHVSLVLAVVLGLLNHPSLVGRLARPGVVKLTVGSVALITYALITGAQPSIMRATVMGLGVLVGIVLERQVKPLGCLLLATTVLLLWNPRWIEDIGFQLSVMATLGLVVAVPALSDRLAWLPPGLVSLVAVPLAAYGWTIPLSLFHFNTLTTYSLLLNMVVTPLVSVISLGGIFSGLIALLSPAIAAMVAWLLWLPTHLLIALVEWETHLPGSTLATGRLALWQLFSLYGLYSLYVCTAGNGWQRWQRWLLLWLVPLVALGPLWYGSCSRAQITILAAQGDAVMVVQDRQSTLVVNSGTHRSAFYTLLPFLRQAGINRIDYGVVGISSDADNWQLIAAQTPVRRLYQAGTEVEPIQPTYPLALDHSQPLGRQRIQLLSDTGTALKLSLFGHDWLVLSGLAPLDQHRLMTSGILLASEVLWWDGAPLSPEFLRAIQPRVAIASTTRLSSHLEATLRAQGIQVFWPERDGALTWNPRQNYRAYLSSDRPDPSNLDG